MGSIGEVGDDVFGDLVRQGLEQEGVGLGNVTISPDAQTPVATVLLDAIGEPAYLGHPGSLQIKEFQPEWEQSIRNSEALYADGWAEHEGVSQIILRGFEIARVADVPVFFDPGPGNPDVDSAWVHEAIGRANVLLVNRDEASQITQRKDDESQLAALLKLGPDIVVLKRGAKGLVIARASERFSVEGLAVAVLDAAGAGDAVTGAVLYGLQREMPLDRVAQLANATGAAKVQRFGTGRNLPQMDDIKAMLIQAGLDPNTYLPN